MVRGDGASRSCTMPFHPRVASLSAPDSFGAPAALVPHARLDSPLQLPSLHGLTAAAPADAPPAVLSPPTYAPCRRHRPLLPRSPATALLRTWRSGCLTLCRSARRRTTGQTPRWVTHCPGEGGCRRSAAVHAAAAAQQPPVRSLLRAAHPATAYCPAQNPHTASAAAVSTCCCPFFLRPPLPRVPAQEFACGNIEVSNSAHPTCTQLTVVAPARSPGLLLELATVMTGQQVTIVEAVVRSGMCVCKRARALEGGRMGLAGRLWQRDGLACRAAHNNCPRMAHGHRGLQASSTVAAVAPAWPSPWPCSQSVWCISTHAHTL